MIKNEMSNESISGAPPVGAGGSFPKRDIPQLAESIQPPEGAGGFLQRGKGHHCYTMCGGRNSGLFWGVLFIVIGLYWFGKIAGWFPPEIKLFWPIVFVLTGSWFVVSSLKNKKRHHQNE